MPGAPNKKVLLVVGGSKLRLFRLNDLVPRELLNSQRIAHIWLSLPGTEFYRFTPPKGNVGGIGWTEIVPLRDINVPIQVSRKNASEYK